MNPNEKVAAALRTTFVKTLIERSEGRVSMEEAERIADEDFHAEDFIGDDAPYEHKCPQWLARWVLVRRGINECW